MRALVPPLPRLTINPAAIAGTGREMLIRRLTFFFSRPSGVGGVEQGQGRLGSQALGVFANQSLKIRKNLFNRARVGCIQSFSTKAADLVL
jgi:hypothetical protein